MLHLRHFDQKLVFMSSRRNRFFCIRGICSQPLAPAEPIQSEVRICEEFTVQVEYSILNENKMQLGAEQTSECVQLQMGH
jgi:hypothetical protein